MAGGCTKFVTIQLTLLVLYFCSQYKADTVKPIQQDDNYKEFMSWITDGGLRYAYAKQQDKKNPESYYRRRVNRDERRHIIVVGAGIAGLSAAYELAQIGHEVTILEMQPRVGGRIKTFRFPGGQHSEGGPMRLPPNHFLTKHYIRLFKLHKKPFQNYNENTYMYLYGEKIRMKTFMEKNKKYTNRFWRGWDANLPSDVKQDLFGIFDYYSKTIEPVIQELGDNPSEEEWQKWIEKWSKFSVEDFLRGTAYQNESDPQLRPWSELAIEALKVSAYNPFLDADLSKSLRGRLGQWTGGNLYVPADGFDTLPNAFIDQNRYGWNANVNLAKNIKYGVKVGKVQNLGNSSANYSVKVTGVNTATGREEEFFGDAVIMTLPLNVMKNIEMLLNFDQRRAVTDVRYTPSTKILLQSRTRFWQKDVGQGGFTKTNMMIGQLHYPDYEGSLIADDERGVLVVYTWRSNALSFGAQTHQEAIKSCCKQISKIHPEIESEFEVGNVQAWFSEPSSQGAFVDLRPYQYMNSLKALMRADHPIYLAGEAISWTNGWIQGALFSALNKAFLLQAHFEDSEGDSNTIDPVTMMYKKTTST